MSSSQKKGLYDAVTCVLSCCLQPDSDTQKLAQERLKALEVIDEYPLILSEIIACEDEAFPERHMAAIFLKNYLEDMYLSIRDVSHLHAKSLSKKLCLNLLEASHIKLYPIKYMSGCSLAYLSVLDMWDFINPRIMSLLKSYNPDDIYTGVVLTKQIIIGKFFEENDNYVIESYYFDTLLDILKMTNLFAEARYGTVAPMFLLMKYIKDQNFIPSSLSKLGEVFESALQEPFSCCADFKFKCEIIKCLYHCGETFGNISSSILSPVLPHIGQLLTYCCEQYKNFVKNSEMIPPDFSENSNEPENFFELVTWILEFIKSLIDLMYFDVILDDLDNLLYSLFVFMSCHSNMETELFTDESERDKCFMIRNTCSQIIIAVVKKIESHRRKGREIFYKSLSDVFQKLLQESQENRLNYPLYFVRITESLMYGLGLTVKFFDSTSIQFPINNFIDNWTSLVRSEPNLMLNGRLLWLGAKYITYLSPAIFDMHFKAVLTNCNNNEKYLYTPSLEALKNYLENFCKLAPASQYVITTFSKDIILCLLNLSQKVNGSSIYYLNAIEHFIEYQPQASAEHIDAIQEVILRVVYNYTQNVSVMRAVGFIIAKLAKLETVRQALLSKLLTILLNAVHLNVSKEFRDPPSAPERALDLLNTFVLYSTTPFSDMFLLQAFSGAARLIDQQTSDNLDTYQEAAGNFIITLIIKFTSQLKYSSDEKNKQIVEYLPQLLEVMMQPECNMPGHIFGKLVVVSIISMPEIMEPHFEQILRNVITANCDSFPNLRATWLIFLFICPSGGSALNYLLKMWLPKFNKDVERIERQIMVLATTSIIRHCLDYEDDFNKIVETRVPLKIFVGDELVSEMVNGLEYLYFLAVTFLVYEKRLTEELSDKTTAEHLEDDVEKRDEDNKVLFVNHPLNIDIISHLTGFFEKGCEPYFMVVKKLISSDDAFLLKDLGCAVPEVIQEEAME